MRSVAVIDYGGGNMFSIEHALRNEGASVSVVRDKTDWEAVDPRSVILPGVGAFGEGMEQLRQRGLHTLLRRHAERKRPLLGICLGAQMLFETSSEFGRNGGLGIMSGEVQPFDHRYGRVPHVGWKPVFSTGDHNALFAGQSEPSWMYFVHSYHFVPMDPSTVIGQSSFGPMVFSAAVRSGNTFGVQFHPEKSGDAGLRFLRQFLSREGDEHDHVHDVRLAT